MTNKKLIDPKVFEDAILAIITKMEEAIISDMKANNDIEIPVIEDLLLPQGDLAKAGVKIEFWYDYTPKKIILTDDNKLNVNIERVIGGICPKDEFTIEFRKFPVDMAMMLYKTIYNSFYNN